MLCYVWPLWDPGRLLALGRVVRSLWGAGCPLRACRAWWWFLVVLRVLMLLRRRGRLGGACLAMCCALLGRCLGGLLGLPVMPRSRRALMRLWSCLMRAPARQYRAGRWMCWRGCVALGCRVAWCGCSPDARPRRGGACSALEASPLAALAPRPQAHALASPCCYFAQFATASRRRPP